MSENFELFTRLLIKKVKSNVDFRPSPIKKDADGNYFNDILTSLMESILDGCHTIMAYPSFEITSHFYEKEFYHFVKECFAFDELVVIELPGILTYASVVNSILEGKFLMPFYHELREFGSLRSKVEEGLKEKSKRVKELVNSLIRIEYSSTMNNNKNGEFSILVLDILNGQLFQLEEYAMNNFKHFSRFFLESFLNEAAKLAKESQPLNFYVQLELIRHMTNKVTSERIQAKWNDILGKANFSPEQKNLNEIALLKLRHKNSWTYRALLSY